MATSGIRCSIAVSRARLKFWHECDELGLDESEDKDLEQFIFEFQTTGVKLGGALDGIARGEGFSDRAFTVAYLKRALDHLHKAQAGLEAVAPKKLLPEEMVSGSAQGIVRNSRRHPSA